jgi:hypothetical protein
MQSRSLSTIASMDWVRATATVHPSPSEVNAIRMCLKQNRSLTSVTCLDPFVEQYFGGTGLSLSAVHYHNPKWYMLAAMIASTRTKHEHQDSICTLLPICIMLVSSSLSFPTVQQGFIMRLYAALTRCQKQCPNIFENPSSRFHPHTESSSASVSSSSSFSSCSCSSPKLISASVKRKTPSS